MSQNINKSHIKTRLVTLTLPNIDFCLAEKDIWGVSYDFVKRGCGYNTLKQDEGCYGETADVLSVYSWHVSRQQQKHAGSVKRCRHHYYALAEFGRGGGRCLMSMLISLQS